MITEGETGAKTGTAPRTATEMRERKIDSQKAHAENRTGGPENAW